MLLRSQSGSLLKSLSGSLHGGRSLADEAKAYLAGIAPYHWFDFINDRCLYASNDVGGVSGATGYSFARASTGYYTNLDGTLTSFASGALRRGNRGVLIEGARTNLLLRSQEFDNASWTKTGSTITVNATTAPDGTATADRIVPDTSSSTKALRQIVTSSGANSWSIFVKPDGYTKIGVWDHVTSGAYASFLLSGAGSVLDSGSGASGATISALANGWYRISFVATVTGSLGFSLQVLPDSYTTGTINSAWIANGTSGILIWQSDLQPGAFASSPIVTTTASATRAADVLTCTAGVSYPASLWIEAEFAGGDSSLLPNQRTFFELTNTATDRAILYNVSGSIGLYDESGDVSQGTVNVAGTIPVDTVFKAAGRVATNSLRLAKNGTLSAEDTSAAVPATPNTLSFGVLSGSPYGYIRRAAIFNSALSDAQLQAVTT